MYLKVHRIPGEGEVVAVCDRELMNRTLRHGEVEIRITVVFFGDRLVEEEEAREVLRSAANINLFGRRSFRIACELGLLGEEDCLLIEDVPHAQVYLI
ncbi:MAG TPA: DUF424 domain-containing protein [Methanoregulaceae archaeon]|nr:DUF424 domain-containing protein [Methanoregulaceae archaeon]HOV67137.1 DUF424 domain-containing protein [Methanoregulaceae archaeon]HQJ87538.1 DUF424 domain-containing protein [Methanoregulaceae archaeon]